MKDLSVALAGRKKEDIIIVDNKESGVLDFENVIPIPDFNGDKKDNAFLYLTEYLMAFKEAIDVREKIKRDFYPEDRRP